MPITSEQSRAARALLGWTQEDLERRSGVAKKTIADFERGARSPHPRNRDALEATMAGAGAIFIPENGQGPGVRLSKIAAVRLIAAGVRSRVAQALERELAREVGPADREISERVIADLRAKLAELDADPSDPADDHMFYEPK